MRIGVMGVHYGHIGGMFRSAAQAPDGEIVGIVEADDALYQRYAGEQGIPRFQTLKQMLDEAGPELVLEGVTHPQKTALVETCAAAGAHLLLDKPLCRSLDDWQRIRDAIGRHNVKLSMFILMGTEGSAHLRAYAEDHLLVVSNASRVREPEMPADRGSVFVQNMIEAIDRGEEPFISTRDVLAVAHACLIAQESARRNGEFLEIPPVGL